ncbi:hypothetical protein [Candidatus Alkanophaga liquidiphilum]
MQCGQAAIIQFLSAYNRRWSSEAIDFTANAILDLLRHKLVLDAAEFRRGVQCGAAHCAYDSEMLELISEDAAAGDS